MRKVEHQIKYYALASKKDARAIIQGTQKEIGTIAAYSVTATTSGLRFHYTIFYPTQTVMRGTKHFGKWVVWLDRKMIPRRWSQAKEPKWFGYWDTLVIDGVINGKDA